MKYVILLLFFSSLLLPAGSVQIHTRPISQHNYSSVVFEKTTISNTHILAIQQDFGVNSTEIIDPIIQAISDIFWELINLGISYIPFVGSNGSVFVDMFFYLCIFGGLVVTIKLIREV